MTPEDKELLLKDLCARLPYKPIVQVDGCGIWDLRGIDHDDSAELRDRVIVWHGKNYPSSKNSFPIINCKPYLFPLSSMTEEQKQEYSYIVNYLSPDDTDNWKEGEFVYVDQMSQLMHFFYRNHLDFRGLIKQDLAIDATGLNIY